MHRLLVACLIALALAGCLDADPVRPSEPVPAVEPIPSGLDHDHADPAQHDVAFNAELLAYDDLARFGRGEEQPVGAHAMAIHEDLLAVAVNGAETGEGQNGFHLFRVGGGDLDHLSYYDAGQEVNGDRTIAFASDGLTVFLGYEGGARPGVAAVDVSDVEDPVEVAFYSDDADFGPHTVAAGSIGGEEHVFLLSLGVTILGYDGDFTLKSKFVTQDEASILDALGMINTSSGTPTGAAQTYALRSLYGHDMNHFFDEETGKDLLMVAYAYDGAKIVDVSQPEAPLLQASWVPPADTGHKHYTHSMTAERIDGRLIAVVGSETFEPENQGIASPIWVLDATEAVAGAPKAVAPELISTWRNPDEVPAGNLGLSVHFFRQQDGLLYLSHYHGGIFGIDLRTEEARAEAATFAFINPIHPDSVRPHGDCCIGFDLDGAPMVFDVEVGPDGIVYGADIIQGVTAIRMDPDA